MQEDMARDADATDMEKARPQSAAGLDPVDEQPETPQWVLDLIEEEEEEAQLGKSLPGPGSARLVLLVRRRG